MTPCFFFTMGEPRENPDDEVSTKGQPNCSNWGGTMINRGKGQPVPGLDDQRMCLFMWTSKEVGDPDHLKVFSTAEAADTWLEENEPECVAFEYAVLE